LLLAIKARSVATRTQKKPRTIEFVLNKVIRVDRYSLEKRKPHCMILCSGVMGDGGHAVRCK